MDDLIYTLAQEKGLSDIHFQTDLPIAVRIYGKIIKKEDANISKTQISKFISDHIKNHNLENLKKEKSLDLAIQIKDLRFRANIFEGMNGKNIVLRKIDTQIPN